MGNEIELTGGNVNRARGFLARRRGRSLFSAKQLRWHVSQPPSGCVCHNHSRGRLCHSGRILPLHFDPAADSVSSTMLKRTALYDFHASRGGKLVEFAGWEMPILYRGIVAEHEQTRKAGSIFDVSHMGRLYFTGPDTQK